MNSSIQEELARIARENHGILKPEIVVESARSEDSPLHDSFTWDDTEAAKNYRLWQARQLIRCVVITEPRTNLTVRAFVSLTPDRNEEGGGYRETIAVLSRPGTRAQLLEDALGELRVFEAKYRLLTELSGVFGEVERLRRFLRNNRP